MCQHPIGPPSSRNYLRVKHTLGKKAPSRRLIKYGISSTNIQFGLHNSSLVNSERALRERVFAVADPKIVGGFVPPPDPKPNIFGTLSQFRHRVLTYMGSTAQKITGQQFVDHYSGRRRAVYQRALDSLQSRPVCEQDAELRSFVKSEKLNLSAKSDPTPRIIQPRDPRYNVEVGCYIKHLEHRFYKAIGRAVSRASPFNIKTTPWYKRTVVAKGMNALETGALISAKWHSFSRPVGIGIDASRFDQHVHVDALDWEHTFYSSLYPGDTHLRHLLRMQRRNCGFCRTPDGTIRYHTLGKRCSGDMNTALGNVILMCGMLDKFTSSLGFNSDFINNGDDAVIFVEAENAASVVAALGPWFLDYGFEMKVEEPVNVLERVEFCQTFPVQYGDSYIMVRNPRIALAKDSCSVKPFGNPAELAAYVHVLGKGGLTLTGGLPIWQDFYSHLINNGALSKMAKEPVFETGMMQLSKGMGLSYGPIAPRTRYSFWLAFSITPDEQLALERYIRCAGPIGWGEVVALPTLPLAPM